jgi:curved DNA-binding protein CbpA
MPLPEPLPTFDLYAELGIGRAADARAIETAWRQSMRRHHPDVAGGEATAQAVRLNIAREWLLDAERRSRYDAFRWPPDIVFLRPADIPPIDPLGPWPARRRRRPPNSGPVVAIAVMLALTGLTLGPGLNRENLPATFLLLLGAFVLTWIALTSLLRLIVATRTE